MRWLSLLWSLCWPGGRGTRACSEQWCWRHYGPLHEHNSVAYWPGCVVKTRSARLPGLGQAVWLGCQARLYRLHMEELEEEGKKKLFTQMPWVQSATWNWDSLAKSATGNLTSNQCSIRTTCWIWTCLDSWWILPFITTYNNQNSHFQFAWIKRRKMKRKSGCFNLLGSPYNQGSDEEF